MLTWTYKKSLSPESHGGRASSKALENCRCFDHRNWHKWLLKLYSTVTQASLRLIETYLIILAGSFHEKTLQEWDTGGIDNGTAEAPLVQIFVPFLSPSPLPKLPCSHPQTCDHRLRIDNLSSILTLPSSKIIDTSTMDAKRDSNDPKWRIPSWKHQKMLIYVLLQKGMKVSILLIWISNFHQLSFSSKLHETKHLFNLFRLHKMDLKRFFGRP